MTSELQKHIQTQNAASHMRQQQLARQQAEQAAEKNWLDQLFGIIADTSWWDHRDVVNDYTWRKQQDPWVKLGHAFGYDEYRNVVQRVAQELEIQFELQLRDSTTGEILVAQPLIKWGGIEKIPTGQLDNPHLRFSMTDFAIKMSVTEGRDPYHEPKIPYELWMVPAPSSRIESQEDVGAYLATRQEAQMSKMSPFLQQLFTILNFAEGEAFQRFVPWPVDEWTSRNSRRFNEEQFDTIVVPLMEVLGPNWKVQLHEQVGCEDSGALVVEDQLQGRDELFSLGSLHGYQVRFSDWDFSIRMTLQLEGGEEYFLYLIPDNQPRKLQPAEKAGMLVNLRKRLGL